MRGLPKKFRADTASLFLVGFMTHNIRKGFGFRALSVFIRVLFLLKLFFKGAAPALFLYRLLDKIRPRVYFRILKFKPRIVYAPYILTTARSFKICFG